MDLRTTTRQWITPALGIALFAGTAALPAYALNAKISGWVDRAVWWASNGEQSDFGQGTNGGASTRFRFTGSQKFQALGQPFTVGLIWENEVQNNISYAWDIGNTTENRFNHGAFRNRKAEAYLSSPTLGKLWVGRGDVADSYVNAVDLSGTEYFGGGWVGTFLYSGSITFRRADGQPMSTPFGFLHVAGVQSIGGGVVSHQPIYRYERVRYDTPHFGPLYLSVSGSNGGMYNVSGHYKQAFSGGTLAAAAGFHDTESHGFNQSAGHPTLTAFQKSIDRIQEWEASASYLVTSGPLSGFNISATYSNLWNMLNSDQTYTQSGYRVHGTNSFFYAGQLGYKFDNNNFSAGYGYAHGQTPQFTNLTTGQTVSGSHGHYWDVAYNYTGIKSTILYAAFYQYGAGFHHGPSLQNIDQVYTGIVVKF